MCDPATGVMVGTSVIGTTLTIADKMSQRGTSIDNRQAAINGVLNETIPSINESLAQTYNSNAARTIQERDKAAVERFDILRGMAEAKGTATAAAGDAGVGGVSFSHILSDYETREGMAAGNLDYNVISKTQQIADENAGQERRAQGAINSAVNQAITSTPVPSMGSTFAGIASDSLKGGLTIASQMGAFEKGGIFGKKIDPATGASFDHSVANWSK